jgi:hypothetical protein
MRLKNNTDQRKDQDGDEANVVETERTWKRKRR